MEYTQISYEFRDEVAVITLNRPERLNAWTPTMAEEQVDAITRANEGLSGGSDRDDWRGATSFCP